MKTKKSTNNFTLTGIILSTFLLILGTTGVFAADAPGDKEITNAVDEEMMLSSAVPSYLIDVETHEGIVTLNGSVNNLLAKDRAEKIAGTVKGVRAVINQIDVDAPYRTNAVLQNDIKNALLSDPATDSYEVTVSANDGTVTLNGTVESWQEKQLSGFVAKGVKGVKQVNNNININYETDRNDFEIKAEIEQTLKNDILVDNSLINVNVNNGDVTLSGTVGSANEKYIAQADAWVTGVNSVNSNNLEVKEWARNDNLRKNKYEAKSDQDIKDAVKDAFLYDPRVYSFNPEVTVNNGIVTLTGQVDNLKAKQAAEKDAKNVVGVFGVNNYLKVRPVYIPEDSELESDIATSLRQDPLVDKWEIDVTADNGVVYLSGNVDSYFEKNQAGDVASKTKGVVAVNNNIQVNNELINNGYNDYYGWNTYYFPFYFDVSDNYKTDTEIKNDIESQLWWSPYVNQDDVEVKVSGSEATLNGTVETEREKLYAEINALQGGATEVKNNIVVLY